MVAADTSFFSGSVAPKISPTAVLPIVGINSSQLPALISVVSPKIILWISSNLARFSDYGAAGASSGLAGFISPNKAPIPLSTPIPISL